MRNVMKQAKEGKAKIQDRFSLEWGEMEQFCELYKGKADVIDLYDVINTAFHMGYNVGCNHPTGEINA